MRLQPVFLPQGEKVVMVQQQVGVGKWPDACVCSVRHGMGEEHRVVEREAVGAVNPASLVSFKDGLELAVVRRPRLWRIAVHEDAVGDDAGADDAAEGERRLFAIPLFRKQVVRLLHIGSRLAGMDK